MSLPIARRGLLLVLSSPSGAGKTTLCRRLLDLDAGIALSVSVTTRGPRPGEIDGRDYVFVDEARFQTLRDAGDLLEWAHVFGRFYGTPRQPVLNAIAGGRDMLFDIDWQGTRQLAEAMPADLVRVFILPPSGEALHVRLRSRNQDCDATVARRMAEASTEIAHWGEYDYVLVNANLEESAAHLQAILVAERLKRARQSGLASFVRGVQDAL